MVDRASEAWRTFCAELEAAGLEGLSRRSDLSERDRLEGLRYLTNQLADALRSQVALPRAAGPYLYRFSDELSPHGLPNADNNYLYSPVDPQGSYRLSGNARGRDFIVTLAAGHFPTWDYEELAELSAEDVSVDAEGSFSITISPEPGPDGLRMPSEAKMLLIRDYVVDWNTDPGLFHLERLDRVEDPTPEADAERLPERLALAGNFFRATATLWGDYTERFRTGTPNQFTTPGHVALGSATLLGYSSAWLRQEPGDALLIEFTPPAASYWSIQLYSRWGVLPAAGIAQTSLNCRQVVVDDDGTVRIAACGSDPGVVNWLDTRGIADGLVWLRAKPWAEFPVPRTRSVPIDRLPDALPRAQRIDADGRRRALADRERQMSKRFRR